MSEKDIVEKLGELSRIDIPADEWAAFSKEFESILAYVGALETLELDMGAPEQASAVHNVFRTDGDAHEAGAFTKDIVEAFPEKEGNSLKVKQILSYE